MPDKITQPVQEKVSLHPRNAHRNRYDFPRLIKALPLLSQFVSANNFDVLSIDFKDPEAVKMLNRALLKHFYQIDGWDIPEGYLCPPIPGRADYMHYMADVLCACNNGTTPLGKTVKVLDIGVGANCIYPIIGHKTYNWNFVGSDVDSAAVESAKNIVSANGLVNNIDIRKQLLTANIFKGIIKPGELFDLTVCNPPFHSSFKEAAAGSARKWKNLGVSEKSKLNFGGKNNELWCEGGEERFMNKMISESAEHKTSCFWFSSLVSKKTTLPACYKNLAYFGATAINTIQMVQGQKTSRILVWTFLNETQQQDWRLKHWAK